MNKVLYQTLSIIEGLCNKAKTLAMSGEFDSDLQKAIVGIIRGAEFAFEELTGVKYNTVSGITPWIRTGRINTLFIIIPTST